MEENAIMIAKVAAPIWIMMGLSILLYAKTWGKIMKRWSKDHLEIFAVMFLYPILGMIIIRMYNVWDWNVWLIVTLMGWGMFLKGIMYFLLPGAWMKKWMTMADNAGLMYFAGLFALVVGVVLGYYACYV